jgi:hypothetical protein
VPQETRPNRLWSAKTLSRTRPGEMLPFSCLLSATKAGKERHGTT